MIFLRYRQFFSVLVSVQTIYYLFLLHVLTCNCRFYSVSLKLKMTHDFTHQWRAVLESRGHFGKYHNTLCLSPPNLE